MDSQSLIRVPPPSLVPHPHQASRTYDDRALRSLAHSIRAFGLLQPIVATRTPGGFMVVAGERRRRAAIMAGVDEVEVLVVAGHPAEISLIENLQRATLKPVEEAEALAQLSRGEGHSHEHLAWITGRSRSSISELLSIARMPAAIKEACRNSDLPKSALIEIAKQPSVGEMEALLARLASGEVTTTNIREHSRPRASRLVANRAGAVDVVDITDRQPQRVDAGAARPWLRIPRPPGFFVDETTWRIGLRNIVRGEPTLVCGPTGCGKTELVRLLTRATGRTLYTVNMGATTDARLALIGTIHYNGRRTVFHPSGLVNGIQDPRGLVLLDEISRCIADAGHILFPLLDHQRTLSIDEADPPVVIQPQPGVCFFATANVGAEYTGARALDRALLDRFTIITLDYPPEDDETDVLAKSAAIPRWTARNLVAFATRCRQAWRQDTLSTPVSTRDLLRAARLIADGFDVQIALNVAVVALFDDSGGASSERTAVRQLLQKA
jgi:ParB/RepB/Spo0J family partition protein